MGDTETLGFSIPEQKSVGADHFLINPKAVATWVEDLPIANVGETARKIYKAIYDFNQIMMPDDVRLKIADLFISPVVYITNNLEKHYSDTTFPLSEKARKVALLTRALNAELATAYKIVVHHQINQGIDKKTYSLAAQRALQFTLRVLRQSALTYRNYPKGVWRETHIIYYFAVTNQADRIPIKSPLEKDSASVNDLYKRILLFNLSDHFRLRQRDIQEIYNNLGEWSSQTRLTMQARMKNRKNQFVIYLRRNTPPVHLSLVDKEPGKDTVIIDTSMLEENLIELKQKALLNNLTGLREINGLSEKILDHLHYTWSVVPERNYSRTQLNFELHIAIGLPAIYSLLLGAKELSDSDLSAEDSGPFDGFSDHSELSDDIDSNFWEQGIDGLSTMSQSEPVTIDHSVGSADVPNWVRGRQRSHQTVACKTLNESAGGYCISWKGKHIPKIKIGELIGIRHATKKDRYSLAVTRWMKYEKGTILLGVAIIAPGCHAVEARLTTDETSPLRDCLLVPGQKDTKPPSLVIPPLAFRPGQNVILYTDSGEMRIQLSDLLEGSGAFNQFSYEELSQPQGMKEIETVNFDMTPSELGEKIEAQEDSGFAKDDSGFDTIWSVL